MWWRRLPRTDAGIPRRQGDNGSAGGGGTADADLPPVGGAGGGEAGPARALGEMVGVDQGAGLGVVIEVDVDIRVGAVGIGDEASAVLHGRGAVAGLRLGEAAVEADVAPGCRLPGR